MSKVWKCDRCQKTYPESESAQMYSVVVIHNRSFESIEDRRTCDICRKCYDVMFAFDKESKEGINGVSIS